MSAEEASAKSCEPNKPVVSTLTPVGEVSMASSVAVTAEVSPSQSFASTAVPRPIEEVRLGEALTRFYIQQQNEEKLANVNRIAKLYAGEGVVELWASLGRKYDLEPYVAMQWLASTLGEQTAIQWPKDEVPEAASIVLGRTEVVASSDSSEDTISSDRAADSAVAEVIVEALDANNVTALGAIAFRRGCPLQELRPRLWLQLLDSKVDPEERRRSYRELRSEVESDMASVDSADTSMPGKAFREQVSADVAGVWGGDATWEAFSIAAWVIPAVISIVLTRCWRLGGLPASYVRGSCEMAALLYYVMAENCGTSAERTDAEADAFFCLQCVLSELLSDAASSEDARQLRVHQTLALLKLFDPALAALLAARGLDAWAAMKLGAALCTRSGLALSDCIRVWDAFLGDPRRFEFRDHVVVALLMIHRADILHSDSSGRGGGLLIETLIKNPPAGGMRELLLALPRRTDISSVMSTAFAICALHRRCGPKSSFCKSGSPYPCPWPSPRTSPQSSPELRQKEPRTSPQSSPELSQKEPADGRLAAADGYPADSNQSGVSRSEMWKGNFSSLLGKVHSVSVEAWDAGRIAARDSAMQARLAVASAASAVSEAAASAATELSSSQTSPTASRKQNEVMGSGIVSDADEVDSMFPIVFPVTLESCGVEHTLLTTTLAMSLLEFLPAGLRVPEAVVWSLRYKPKVHGTSMATLFRNIADCQHTILVVQDADDHIFGGFAPSPWETVGRFHGSGEAFVFTFGLLQDAVPSSPSKRTDGSWEIPRARVFPWTTSNSYFMYADHSLLAMGGGDGHYALAVQEGLLHGHSSATPTFGNVPLSAAPDGDFVVKDLELWALDEVDSTVKH